MSKIYDDLKFDDSSDADLSRIAGELASGAEDRASEIARIKESLHAEQQALDKREMGLGARERELEEQCRKLETATRESATTLEALRNSLENEQNERARIEARESEAIDKLQTQLTELEEAHVVTTEELRDARSQILEKEKDLTAARLSVTQQDKAVRAQTTEHQQAIATAESKMQEAVRESQLASQEKKAAEARLHDIEVSFEEKAMEKERIGKEHEMRARDLEAQVGVAKEEATKLREEIDTLKQEHELKLDEMQHAVENHATQLSAARTQISELTEVRDTFQGEQTELQTQHAEAAARDSEKIESLGKELQELTASRQNDAHALEASREELAALVEEKARVEREAAKQRAELEARLERSKAETMEAAVQLELVQTSISDRQSERQEMEKRLKEMDNTLNRQIDDTKRRSAELEQERATLQMALEEEQKRVEASHATEKGIREQLAAAEAGVHELETQNVQLQGELRADSQRHRDYHDQSADKLKGLQGQLEHARASLAESESSNAELTQALEEHKTRLKSVSDDHGAQIRELQESLDQATQLRQEFEADARKTEEELNTRIRELETGALEASTNLNTARHEAEVKLQQLAGEHQKGVEQGQAMEKKIEQLQAELQATRDEAGKIVSEAVQDKEAAEEQNAKLLQQLEEAQTQATDTSRQAQEHEAFAQAEHEDVKRPGRESTWYLKLDDGSEFGPVAFKKLLDWAQQGRIGPDHSISDDGSTWQHAREIKCLHMHWNVELVNGTTYGPINLSAIRYLMEDGSVARSATIENVDTGDTMRALHMLSPEIQELYATIQEQSQMLDSLTRELEQQREKVARLKTSSGEADTSAPIPGTPPKLVRNRILKKDE